MPIHEKSLIRPENLHTHEELVIDGVDVSGHWSTFIESRVVSDYNEALEDEIAALPGGEQLDLPDSRGHGIGTTARQGHHLAMRIMQ
jgi:hypothetical protein